MVARRSLAWTVDPAAGCVRLLAQSRVRLDRWHSSGHSSFRGDFRTSDCPSSVREPQPTGPKTSLTPYPSTFGVSGSFRFSSSPIAPKSGLLISGSPVRLWGGPLLLSRFRAVETVRLRRGCLSRRPAAKLSDFCPRTLPRRPRERSPVVVRDAPQAVCSTVSAQSQGDLFGDDVLSYIRF